ncbi:uncharacterized protein B0P05DRAFT_562427 [Gilbertella persicaria]|uniref:uncharacterized protein n=1 Tax=Gilbertella persicaria TaxID=101096 RepID=UPI0022212439|nr:uncharacterized protein B0P05DRAFT_562427 [Gilbertella persicaria]KAI8051364.1 hypothetical protein B0P05DRAFT_562427 [Gilbertella persicaria]
MSFSDQDNDFLDQTSLDEYQESEVLDTMFAQEPFRSYHQVDYSVKTVDELAKMQTIAINHVSSLIELNKDDTLLLLGYFKWNKEKLVESYLTSSEKTLHEAGISLSKTNIENDTSICDICFDQDSVSHKMSIACGHLFCQTCYAYYVNEKIKSSLSPFVACPQDGCQLFVRETVLKSLLNSAMKIRYQHLLTQKFVDNNPFLKWCPAPECEFAIECHVSSRNLDFIVPTVRCRCGYLVCFGCGLEGHQPTLCALVKKWLLKCKEDTETAKWISDNTKECGQCFATIEKNGGCNHMTCKKCQYQFCWLCLKNWSSHQNSYQCNRFAGEQNKVHSESKSSIERYLHYFTRYTNHEESAKLQRVLYAKTEKIMVQMQQTNDLSWIEVQFLKRAVDIAFESRSTLKWTYAFAFYLQKSNETTLFEDNQRDLEMATEQLSELLENPLQKSDIASLRQNVLDKSVYVTQRQQTLLSDTAKGLQEGRWLFNVDIYS